MMGFFMFASIAFICLSAIYAQQVHHAFKDGEREHKDVLKLSELLEKRLASMEELKGRMESLLLKNGFGRQ